MNGDLLLSPYFSREGDLREHALGIHSFSVAVYATGGSRIEGGVAQFTWICFGGVCDDFKRWFLAIFFEKFSRIYVLFLWCVGDSQLLKDSTQVITTI